VNLNVGCPSKTVVTKGRGSGFLRDPRALDEFFANVFKMMSNSDMKVSVKTRIGLDSPLEFEDILNVYNRYPISELIIHPRLQLDYYKNTPNWEVFQEAVDRSCHTLCYNGDIFYENDYARFRERFPQVECVMLGRGIIAFPDLVDRIKGTGNEQEKYKKLKHFHDELVAAYWDYMPDDKNVLFKMKEFWSYCQHNFPDDPKFWKKIKKCQKLDAYRDIIETAFNGK